MCAARWPNVICSGVGLELNLSAGISAMAPTVFLARLGSISRRTLETGFLASWVKAHPRADDIRPSRRAHYRWQLLLLFECRRRAAPEDGRTAGNGRQGQAGVSRQGFF